MSAFPTPLEYALGLSSRLRRSATSILLLLTAFAAIVIWLAGSYNPFTPAGYVGYLTRGAILGKSTFYGVQRGPTSPGTR